MQLIARQLIPNANHIQINANKKKLKTKVHQSLIFKTKFRRHKNFNKLLNFKQYKTFKILKKLKKIKNFVCP